MTRTAVGLYTLRNAATTLSGVLARVERTDFEGVELAAFEETPREALVSAFADTPLENVGIHVDLADLENDYESVVERYEDVACDRIVALRRGDAPYEGPEDVAAVAHHLSEAADHLADDGYRLAFHHLVTEFGRLADGALVLDRLLAELDSAVTLEYDVGLAVYGGEDADAALERHADRIDVVHFTDTRTETDTRHVELGAGEVDLQGTMDAVLGARPDWVVYEHGATTDPLASLAHANALLPVLVDGRGQASSASVDDAHASN